MVSHWGLLRPSLVCCEILRCSFLPLAFCVQCMRYLLYVYHGQQAMPSEIDEVDRCTPGNRRSNTKPLPTGGPFVVRFIFFVCRSSSGTPKPWQAVMEEYDARIDNTGGAVFLAVCRGKVVIVRPSTCMSAMFLVHQ